MVYKGKALRYDVPGRAVVVTSKTTQSNEQQASRFTARVNREGIWFVAQAIEIDIASQGKSESEAIANLREALELYFAPDGPTSPEDSPEIEVSVAAT